MDREKQIKEITKVITRRSMAFRNPNVAFMTTARKTANSLYNAGYRKQSEFIAEFSEAVKHIAEGVKFKNDTEKTTFIEMLDDLIRVKMKVGE